MYLALIGLGSNLGNREEHLRLAVSALRGCVGVVLQQSALYYSLPVGFESGNHFVNQVVAVATRLEPCSLLVATQDIERQLGRTEKSHNGIHHDRTIDIDLLRVFEYDSKGDKHEVYIDTPTLTLPHPCIAVRPFVYLPMSEIYSD